MRRRKWAPREDDRARARRAISSAVRLGKMPSAAQLECADCHGQASEYDHHLGYAHAHRLAVHPVCVSCHVARGKARGEFAAGERNGTHTRPETRAFGDRNGVRTRPDRVARGERQGSAKLTRNAVAVIRALHQNGRSQRSIADELDVSQRQVGRVIRGESWAHIDALSPPQEPGKGTP